MNNSNELSPNGIYGVNFYSLGVPHTVIVDDYLPLREWGDGHNTLFAHIGPDSSLWGSILEKAFAKYHGNYKHLVAGNPMYAIRTLSGAPFIGIYHKEKKLFGKEGITVDALWDKIV